MSKKDNSPKPLEMDQQGVDQIRDIMFGPQMREYELRFQQLKRDVERMQQEMDRLSNKLIDQDAEQLKKLQGLQQDMRKSDDGLRDELRESVQQLMTEKMDRLTLGELFIELGNNLKSGGSLTDLLGALAQGRDEG